MPHPSAILRLVGFAVAAGLAMAAVQPVLAATAGAVHIRWALGLTAPGLIVAPGSAVTWSYLLANTGNVPLLGIAVTDTKLENSAVFAKAGADISNAAVPTLRVHKGLPFGIDVGVMAGAVPSTNIRLFGGELRYAIVAGGTAMPAIGIRGSYTKLSGVDRLDFDTKGVDLSISKGFLMFTPYGGVGKVWASSTPNGTPALSKESLSMNKVFVGINMNFGLTNLAFEGDRTGKATSYGAKLGFRF